MSTQAETPAEHAAHLLKMLDLQIAQKRALRTSTNPHRAAVLVGGLVLLILGTAAGLLFLFSQLSDLAHERASEPVPAASAPAQN